MGAAAEDLDFRQRNDRRRVAEAIAPERKIAACRGGVKNAKRNRGQRVSPEPRLVRRAVDRDELQVDAGLIERVKAEESRRNFRANPCERLLHVKAAEMLASVPFVDRLAAAARSAGGRDSPSHRAIAQRDLRLDGRPAARIPDAPRGQSSG